jgi:epoxyqueuosine reductase
MESIESLIKAEAASLGFSFIHFGGVDQSPHFNAFLDWLSLGYSGDMQYLSREYTIQSRRSPASLMKNAQSFITFGFHYPPLTTLPQEEPQSARPLGRIASYACYQDYHPLLKEKAHELMDRVNQQRGEKAGYRVFVDSSPLMEKDTAFMTGAGWIGKNSLLITPGMGSFQVIGCILTDLQLSASRPSSADMCGSCRKCITACPSGCITDNHYIDASKCNAYLTIEYKGVVPRELRPNLGNWIYGCDICQNVCPHNISAQKKIPPMKTIFSQKVNAYVDLIKELQITPGEFQEKYEQTSVLRATHDGFRRNILIAMGNSGNADCIPALKEVLLSDPSWELRLQAAWALGQIGTQAGMLILEGVLEREQDQRVKEEAYFSLKIDK